jgi:hypothetical protein
MTASLGIRVIRSSLVDWWSMKKRVQTCAAHPPLFEQFSVSKVLKSLLVFVHIFMHFFVFCYGIRFYYIYWRGFFIGLARFLIPKVLNKDPDPRWSTMDPVLRWIQMRNTVT